MSVNMTSLWELITEVTTHTEQIIDLVILGIVISIVLFLGAFVVGIATGDAGPKQTKSPGVLYGATGGGLPWMPKRK